MVKICHSFVLIAAAHASEDGEAMLQVGKQQLASAQTDSTVRASRHQQALQMESNFEKLAAEAVRTGVTPSLGSDARSAVNSALDTLEGELEKEKIANDAEMVGANDQCANCNKARKDAFDKTNVGVDARASLVQEARSKHAACRVAEDPNCGDEQTTCLDQDNYAKTAHVAGPKCPCEDYKTADAMKKCLDNAVDWGKTYNTELGNKITACDAAEEVANKVAKTCDKDQTDFEMAFCSYEVSIKTTCESHSECYEAAVRSRGIVVINLKAKEASEKIMWKSCKKVRCYLGMLDATQVSQDGFDACKRLSTDTKHLDVIYSPAPAKEDCDTTPVKTVPGDPAWLEAEYAKLAPKKIWLSKRNGIEDVKPCPKPELQTSLVLPTKPTEKTRLGENGGGIFVPQP